MKRKLSVLFCASLLGLSVLLSGCGNAKEEAKEEEAVETVTPTPEATETPTATPTPTEEPEPELKAIGTESETAYKVRLTNLTGIDINGVTIKAADDAAYPENFLAEGDVYAINEERYLYFEPQAEAPAEGTEEAAADEKALEAAYDVQFSFANGLVLVVHSFPFGDMEEAELYAQDSVAFLKYESAATGEMVDTKEAELAIFTAEQEAAAAAAAEAAAESYEEPAYEETYYEESYYEEPAYEDNYYEEPTYEEPSYDGGGSDDSCLDGGLLY